MSALAPTPVEMLKDLWHFIRWDIVSPLGSLATLGSAVLLSHLHIHPKKLQPLQLFQAIGRDDAGAAERLLSQNPQLMHYTLNSYAARAGGQGLYDSMWGNGPSHWDLFETAVYRHKPGVAAVMIKHDPSLLTRNYNIKRDRDGKAKLLQPAMPLLQMLVYHDMSSQMAMGAARLLLKAGADVNGRDSEGCTVLHHAARRERSAFFNYFTQEGADVNARNNHGCPPLFHLCDRIGWYKDILKQFVENGADMQATSNLGNNAAMAAVIHDSPRLAAQLIAMGLSIDHDAPAVEALMGKPAALQEEERYNKAKSLGSAQSLPLPFNQVIRDLREKARAQQRAIDEITEGSSAPISVTRLKLKS